MERLTEKCWRNLDPWECCGQDHYCTRGCHDLGGCTGGCIVPKLYARLATYEDTGLEPDEVKRLLEPEPNPPLTLEDLWEMDGEPVWVVELNDYPPHWGLVYWCRKNKRNIVYVTINNGASICADAFIAAGGRIYRRKPEGPTP